MNSLRRLKFETRSLVAREPVLEPLFALVRWYMQLQGRGRTGPREHVVDARTELVIDGIQGSANSFATAAFHLAQKRPVDVAHHLHSPSQILKATRIGVPTLVTIREPTGVAQSLASRWPYVRAKQALRAYLRFYGRIQDASDRYVIGLFPVCTREMGSVIHAVNRKFGTDFLPFEHTEENVRMIRNPSRVAEHKAAREQLKQRISEELESPSCEPLLRRARDLYRRFESLAPGGE